MVRVSLICFFLEIRYIRLIFVVTDSTLPIFVFD